MADRPAVRTSSLGDRPRVLLVDPYMAREDPMERKHVELYPSLGLLQLGGYLRDHGVETEVVDLTFDRDISRVRRAIRSFSPHVVGVHTKTLTIQRASRVAATAREEGVFSVAGGPDSATRPETYLHAGFNAVAMGEGEATLAELSERLAAGLPTDEVAGLAIWEMGKVRRNPDRPFLAELDSLPLPAWDLVDMERYLDQWYRRTGERRAAVLTSRGCPFDCSWCSKPTFGRSFRQQSVPRVMSELIALARRYRVDYVRFCDDVFGINRRWLDELLANLLQEDLGIRFECLARVDLLKPDLLPRMRRAGLARVYLGVESGSQRMLDRMNRGTSLRQVEAASSALRVAGVRQFWFLMLGYPGERLEDIDATLRLFRKFSPEEYSVSIAVPIPGTRFFESVKDRLRGRRARSSKTGGKTLLYEAVYPEKLYRWEQARFRLEAALGQARGKLAPVLLSEIARASDAFHERIARPLLTGNSESVCEDLPVPIPMTRGGEHSILPKAPTTPSPRTRA